MKARVRKLSVTVQIVLLVFVLFVPVSLVIVYYSTSVYATFKREMEETIANVAKTYMQKLDQRMYLADIYAVTATDKNEYVLRLRNHKAGTEFKRDMIIETALESMKLHNK